MAVWFSTLAFLLLTSTLKRQMRRYSLGDKNGGNIFQINRESDCYYVYILSVQENIQALTLQLATVEEKLENFIRSRNCTLFKFLLLRSLKTHFALCQYEDPHGSLFKLTQKSTVAVYQTQFESLSNRICGLSAHSLLSCFVQA